MNPDAPPDFSEFVVPRGGEDWNVLPRSDPPASTLRSLLLRLPPRVDVFCVYSDDNEDAIKLFILYVHISNDELFVLSDRSH